MKKLLGTLCACVIALSCASSYAQEYPTKPVRLIVPWPPAGPSDILARTLSYKLTDTLRQPIVIDNRAGASGIIGAELASKAPADGYTLLVDNVTGHAINPALYRKLPYSPLRDFAPVAMMASVNNVLVVHPSTPASTIQDVIAAAKAKPGQLAYASFGAGGTAHLAAEHIKAGKLKAIATTGSKRSVVTPNVPTVIESGLAGFEATNWYGALFPAKTPPAVLARMNREINAVMTDTATRTRLVDIGFEVATGTPDEFTRLLKEETAKWAEVVKRAGLQLDY